MSIYKNGKKITTIQKDSKKIMRIYKNSALIFGYPSGTVLFDKQANGSYPLNVTYGCTVEVILVGGGSGGHGYNSNFQAWESGGGSGGYLRFRKAITAGSYTIVVGKGGAAGANPGGNSTAFGQTAGGGRWIDGGGGGGTNSYSDVTVLNNTNGNGGGYAHNGYAWDIVANGGASAYNGSTTSHGAGGKAECHGGRWTDHQGYDGFVKITVI